MRSGSCLHLRSLASASALLLLAAMLAGCSTTPEVTSYVNPVSGHRTDTAQNLLDAPGNNREMLWLNAYRDFPDRNHYQYYLEAIYGARQDVGYLETWPGQSLKIIADGHEMNFGRIGAASKWEDKGALFERADYPISAEDIHRIADAKKVTVQLRGQHGTITRQFGPENFENYRKFVQQSDDANL